MKNCINVSQKSNLIIIKVSEEAEFEDILKNIKAKVAQLKKLYKNEKTPIKVVGKVMKNKEIETIEKIIERELGVEVEFDMPRELGLSNIKRTFDLVLKTAIDNNLSQSDLPDNILIISDMEFDYATVTNGYSHEDNMSKYKTLFENIRTQWESYGYKLPKLIFWNVLSRTNAIQLTENECGVILVSGFSVNNVKMVLSGELDPYKALKFVLDSKRYDKVEDVLKS